MTAAEYQAQYAKPAKPAPTRPAEAQATTDTREAPRVDSRPGSAANTGPGFGVVAVPEFVGRRFVVVGAPPELVEALAGVCRAHGLRELGTGHFIQESGPASGPKEKSEKQNK